MDEDVGTPHASTPANRCSHPSTSFPSPSTSSAHGSAISAKLRRPRGTVPGADVLFARCARTSWKAAATASRKPAPAPWQPSPGTCSSSSALLAGRCQWRYQIRRDLRDFLDDHRLVREERGHLLQPGHRATVGLVGTPDRRRIPRPLLPYRDRAPGRLPCPLHGHREGWQLAPHFTGRVDRTRLTCLFASGKAMYGRHPYNNGFRRTSKLFPLLGEFSRTTSRRSGVLS